MFFTLLQHSKHYCISVTKNKIARTMRQISIARPHTSRFCVCQLPQHPANGQSHIWKAVLQSALGRSQPLGFSLPKPRRTQYLQTRHNASAGGGSGGVGGVGGRGGGGGGGDEGKNPAGGLAGIWAFYLQMLEERPLVTKAITAGFLNMLGDILAQVLIEHNEAHDWKRTAVLTAVGTFLIGPTLHVWYNLLSKLPLTGNLGAAARMALDQFCFAPFFLSAIIGSIITLESWAQSSFLEGHPEQVVPKLKADLFSVLKANWYLWIPFMFLNFRIIPLNLQANASNVMALLWNIYMSFITHRKVEAQPAAEPARGKNAKGKTAVKKAK